MGRTARKLSQGVSSGPLPPAVSTTYVRSIVEDGAVADGITDDYSALAATITMVESQGGGVVLIPDRPVRIVFDTPASGPVFTPSNAVTLRGEGSNAELIIDNANLANWNALFKIQVPDFHIERLKLSRAADFSGAFVVFAGATDAWLYGVEFDGRNDTYTSDWHGIVIDGMSPAVLDGLTMSHVKLRRCAFGLLQDSSRTITVQNVLVDRCDFAYNTASDLEFNAPNSVMQNVQVLRSVFRNNLSAVESAGWGVGLANVQNATIAGNSFYSYGMNAVHIEDRSAQVRIIQNTFRLCSTILTTYMSDIIIISGANTIAVHGNVFDTRSQSNPVDCVYVGAGGTPYQPHDVVVTDNTAYLANGSQMTGVYGAYNVTSSPNTEY